MVKVSLANQEINYYNNYIRNISKLLDKAKAKYPDCKVDEELRGKSSSWSYDKQEDLSPELLKFGKYAGKTIQEVAKIDIQYLKWIVSNTFKTKTIDLIKELPEYKSLIQEREQKSIEATNQQIQFEDGINEFKFDNNPNRMVGEVYDMFDKELGDYKYHRCASQTIAYSTIVVLFDETKYVSGLYPYHMAIINGKATKTKGKNIKLNVQTIYKQRNEFSALQIMKIV